MDSDQQPRGLDSSLIRRRIEQIYAEQSVLDEEGDAHRVLPMSVTPERGQFIASLCRVEQPGAILEIGMAWGLSTLHILAALAEFGDVKQQPAYVVIDPYQLSQFGNAALRLVREVGAEPIVEFFPEGSETVLPRLVLEGRLFDLAFIDGDHRFDAAFIDFFFVHRLLRPGGLVIFDDVRLDGVSLTSRFAETNLGYIPVAQFSQAQSHGSKKIQRELLRRPAIGAWRKPLLQIERDRLHFEPFFDEFIRWRDLRRDSQPDLRRLVRNRESHLGLIALRRGDRVAARRAFIRALRAKPFYMAGYLRLVRTYLPAWLISRLSGRTSRGR
ncbi:MAG: class I SAM-dependent methyltransferase [Candidatus Binataceae bacterium]|nr:class I SAM-dependent methyltransferase [Candidatus Binataceae bacterium]